MILKFKHQYINAYNFIYVMNLYSAVHIRRETSQIWSGNSYLFKSFGHRKRNKSMPFAVVLHRGRRWDGETMDFWRINGDSPSWWLWLCWENPFKPLCMDFYNLCFSKSYKGMIITLIGYYHWALRRRNSLSIIYMHNSHEQIANCTYVNIFSS